MNFIHIQVPTEKAYVLPIGDIHWGDPAFKRDAREKLQGNLDWALERKDITSVVLMGDIFNIAGRSSKTSPFGVNHREIKESKEFFRPYAEAGIIKGAIRGNHEARMVNEFGHDPLEPWCDELHIPYLGVSALLRIQVGQRPDSNSYWNNYYMAIHHTSGGGGQIGSALNSITKLANVIPGCDVYAGGHNHQLVTGKQRWYVPTYSGPQLKTVHYVSCGSYLDYEESYAEEKMLKPSKLGSPRIRFDGTRDKHDVHISI
jgi:hypothetical protein